MDTLEDLRDLVNEWHKKRYITGETRVYLLDILDSLEKIIKILGGD